MKKCPYCAEKINKDAIKCRYCKEWLDGYQESLVDIDGNEYKTVKIGDQIWMAENLKVRNFRNGENIPMITDNSEWAESVEWKSSAFCIYNNDVKLSEKYGNLYNYASMFDLRNIAPEGWHISTDDEWKKLESYLGMPDEHLNYTIEDFYGDEVSYRGEFGYIGCQLKKKDKSWKEYVYKEIEYYQGENEYSKELINKSNFSALPGGTRHGKDSDSEFMGGITNLTGYFSGLGEKCYFGCVPSIKPRVNRAYIKYAKGYFFNWHNRLIQSFYHEFTDFKKIETGRTLTNQHHGIIRFDYFTRAFSIRCVKD